jgi:hypothetical protein
MIPFSSARMDQRIVDEAIETVVKAVADSVH